MSLLLWDWEWVEGFWAQNWENNLVTLNSSGDDVWVKVYSSDNFATAMDVLATRSTTSIFIGHICDCIGRSYHTCYMVQVWSTTWLCSFCRAAVQGHFDVIRVLAAYGADLGKVSLDGNTPMHLAAAQGFGALCKFLAQRGENLAITFSRAVNELLGENICSTLPARRESDTFPARRGWQKFFPGRTFLPGWKKRGRKKKGPCSAAHGRRRDFTLFYVCQEESVFRTDISKNSCRWLLLHLCQKGDLFSILIGSQPLSIVQTHGWHNQHSCNVSAKIACLLILMLLQWKKLEQLAIVAQHLMVHHSIWFPTGCPPSLKNKEGKTPRVLAKDNEHKDALKECRKAEKQSAKLTKGGAKGVEPYGVRVSKGVVLCVYGEGGTDWGVAEGIVANRWRDL